VVRLVFLVGPVQLVFLQREEEFQQVAVQLVVVQLAVVQLAVARLVQVVVALELSRVGKAAESEGLLRSRKT